LERVLQNPGWEAAIGSGGNTMKIYLLMLLVGALFTAIRVTSPQEQQTESLPQ
jgi:hypothetical protein